MNAHGEAPPPDWSLSDLSDEDCERIAERCDRAAGFYAGQLGGYDTATDLAVAVRIIREWNEGR